MASKRMFSEKIVCSDAFMEMPTSTQALYFHLGMKVDDDGFVNPKMIMRMIGANDDELKVLFSKRFVIPFENGVIVLKHHRINNNLDKHNHNPTVYTEQLKTLYIKENKAYTQDETKGIQFQTGNRLKTDCKKTLDKSRVDKIRLDKNKREENDSEETSQDKDYIKINDGIEALKELNEVGYKRWFGNKTQRAAVKELTQVYTPEQLQGMAKFVRVNSGKKYFPSVSTPSQLLEKAPNIKAWADRETTTKHKIYM